MASHKEHQPVRDPLQRETAAQRSLFFDSYLSSLFLLATLAVDLLLLTTDFDWSRQTSHLVITGLLLGQVEALAMWTLRGQLHRLIRASFLVAGVVAVAAAQAYFTERNYARMLGLYTFAAMVMLLATAIADSFRARRVRSKAEVEPSPVRFPLVELFGWTIVVAIGSFFARWIEGRYFPDSSRQIQEAASVLLTPIALAVLVKRDLRELSQTTATLVMLVFVGSLAWITIINHGQFDVTLALCCQGAYLAAWLTVQSIEHIQQEAARLREDACKLQ